MKKITLLTILFAVFTVNAQNFYNFSEFQQDYQDLQEPISINNGQVWYWDTFSEVTMPFNFSVGGQPVDRFLFDDDNFVLLAPGVNYATTETGVYYLAISSLWVQDRSYSTGVSTSPISYKVEGEDGNRILKLEVKNAGLEETLYLGISEDSFYVNYQVWVYEADQSIEFRYGEHNVTDTEYVTEGEGILIGFGDNNQISLVSGNVESPVYAEYTEDTLPMDGYTLNAHPANGTVYRFTPSGTASVPGFALAKMELYPNPASSTLYLKSDTAFSSYTVYDVTGKIILQNNNVGSDTVTINVEGIAPGVYFVKVNNQSFKFIKK